MSTITEDLVYNETHSSTGVSNWDRTTASDDSKASFATVSTGNGTINFGLTNLSQTPTSITSAQMIHESNAGAAATVVIQAKMLNSSDTQINTQYTSFSTVSDNTVGLTIHTTNDLTSAAFTENDINTLRISLTYITESGAAGDSAIDHFYVRVIYEAPDPVGGLIKLNSGLVNLNSGLVKIIA